jgi:aspartate/methionine/tyrosine aminotransferase
MNITPFGLERYFAKYEFKARYLLSSSDCESMPVGDLLDFEPGAREQFERCWLGYTESQGSPELRREIATLYTSIAPEQLLVHAGAEEAIYAFMMSTLNPGDHVVVHAPCYQSLSEIARSVGCEVTPWLTYAANGWELDVAFLRNNIRPNTRLIVVNSPHNPTGYHMTAETQRQIINIARERNITLFSDEVYRHLEHDPRDTLPAVCDLYENAVSLGVLSKTYGLPGLRIGWIATRNHDIYQKIAELKDYLSICNSAPSEFLGTLALRHREALARRSRDIIRTNLDVLDGFFGRYADVFAWWRPKASSTAFPALRLDIAVEAFCADVVERMGVLLLPGTCYGYGDKHFRIGFGRRNMLEALVQFEEYVKESLLV